MHSEARTSLAPHPFYTRSLGCTRSQEYFGTEQAFFSLELSLLKLRGGVFGSHVWVQIHIKGGGVANAVPASFIFTQLLLLLLGFRF